MSDLQGGGIKVDDSKKVNRKLIYENNFSLIFGVLCLGVVYLHSAWAEGFDIHTLGIQSMMLRRGTSLFLMTIVPSFFILWGYLSCKYIYSNDNVLQFLKIKLIQFYPIYLFFFLINVISRPDYMSQIPIWKIILALLGLYYESGLWGGGHIYLVILSVIVTISFFKMCNPNKYYIYLFVIICLCSKNTFSGLPVNLLMTFSGLP